MAETTNWASYTALESLGAGRELESPPSNPFSYLAGTNKKEDKLLKLTSGLPEYAGLASLLAATSKIKAPGFHHLQRMSEGEDGRKSKAFTSSDWKFHISVHPDDVPLAWDSIVDYLQQENVAIAKVATPQTAKEHGMKIDPEYGKANPQAGKMIILYVDETIDGKPGHLPEDWQRIINGIEERLANAGVRPGLEVITDKCVRDSMYTYYRNDRITELMDKAYKKLDDDMMEALAAHFTANARTIMGDAFKEEYDTSYTDAFDRYLESPPKTLALLLDTGRLDAVIRNDLSPEATGLTVEDIEKLRPVTVGDFEVSRLCLIELPPEKRYKLPNQEDPFGSLHIENPHTHRAQQEAVAKDRFANILSGGGCG